MSKKLFVGSLSWNTTNEILRECFERFGVVAEAKVIVDRETNRSRGFGFVSYDDPEHANAAMQAMNGGVLDSRTIRVHEAEERRPPPARDGGGPRRPSSGPPSADGPRPPRADGPVRAEPGRAVDAARADPARGGDRGARDFGESDRRRDKKGRDRRGSDGGGGGRGGRGRDSDPWNDDFE